MYLYLLILFTVVPAIELAVLIKVGGVIGAGNTIFIIILTGVLGASLARQQGFAVLSQIQQDVDRGIIPTKEILNGVMILVGGILLLTPGFITDLMGFLLLIPLSRAILRKILQASFQRMVDNGQIQTGPTRKAPPKDRNIEDAQFYED